MKHTGFLLIELMVAFCISTISMTTIALYGAYIEKLCADTQKRHEALDATRTVIETLQATGICVPSVSIGDITITVTPLDFLHSAQTRETVEFFTIHTTWTSAAHVATSFDCITCLGRLP